MKKIVITGPESCGKTTLAKELALHFKTPFLGEYARTFLNNNPKKYEEADLLTIAKEQIAKEDEILANFDQDLIFLDTDLITIKIWSLEKYNRCDPWILDSISKRSYDLYLLCKPDIPWMADPLRENPKDRARLYRSYQTAMFQYQKTYKTIEGLGQERTQNAVKEVEALLSS